MVIPEPERKLLRTIDPADVRAAQQLAQAAETFSARCLDCPWKMRAKYRQTVEMMGESHVSVNGHKVVIEEEVNE